ncbi:MAG: hypothetical protein GY862_32315, partial [Gammaproteobacteria bacterium]|nr:hypothetical protein [Gammaproteobacteria bacterium]
MPFFNIHNVSSLALLAEIPDKQSVMDLVEMILRYFVQVHPTLEEP